MKDAMQHGNSLSFLCHDINELEHSYQANLPRVTVVMPLKGFGEHNLHNWRSQVRTHRINSSGYYLMFFFLLVYLSCMSYWFFHEWCIRLGIFKFNSIVCVCMYFTYFLFYFPKFQILIWIVWFLGVLGVLLIIIHFCCTVTIIACNFEHLLKLILEDYFVIYCSTIFSYWFF